MLQFDIFGIPVPLARPKFCRRGTFTTTYDSQVKIKEGYCWQLRSQYNSEPLTCPIAISLVFHMPIPTTTSKVRTRQMLSGLIPHIKRPDLDNLTKFILDCLQPLIIKDDSQVYSIVSRKIYSEKPGTSILLIPYPQSVTQGIPHATQERQVQVHNLI